MGRSLTRKTHAWVTIAGSEQTGDKVELYMTPASSLQYELALERAGKAARQLAEAEDMRQAYGLEALPPEAVVEEGEASLGIATTLQATELALIIATDWRGYTDDDGEAAAFNRRNLALALSDWHGIQSLAQHFMQIALAPIFKERAEGKP